MTRNRMTVAAMAAIFAACTASTPAPPSAAPQASQPVGGPSVTHSSRPAPVSSRNAAATPGPTQIRQVFTSRLYGYSVGLPAGWQVQPATVSWPDGAAYLGDTPEWLDVFIQLDSSFPNVGWTAVGAQAIPGGLTAEEWMLAYATRQATSTNVCKGPPEDWVDAVIGNVNVRRIDVICDGFLLSGENATGWHASEIVFDIGRTAYVMRGNPDGMEALLATFEPGPIATATTRPSATPSASPNRLPAGLVAHPAKSQGNDLGLLSYVPPSYGHDNVEWPLLVYLHGYGENGDGSEDELRKVLNTDRDIPWLIANSEWPSELPFVVLMPQYSSSEAQHCELSDEIQSVIEWAGRTYRIDPARIYLTGISCGAIGVWDYLASVEHSEVAATVPISSAPYVGAMQKGGCAIAQTPMWLFHGALDDTVPVHYVKDAVTELQACTDPAPREIKLTVYPDADHGAWVHTYDGSAGHDIYEWLLDHTLAGI